VLHYLESSGEEGAPVQEGELILKHFLHKTIYGTLATRGHDELNIVAG
jgi:hypothetical protein